MYFLRVYLIKTSSAVSLNTATESGIIRWQIDKAASIALASSNWHTLLTPVQEAFRMNKNLVSYFFFFLSVHIDISLRMSADNPHRLHANRTA